MLVVAATVLVLLPSLIEEIKPTANVDRDGVRPGAQDWSRCLGASVGGGIHRPDVECCLGAGAHTHDFSNDAVALADEIDRLAGGQA